MLASPVCDCRDLCAARAEVPRGELAHPSGSDEQDPPACQILEDLLRQRRRRGGHRGRALADRRLDPRPSAGMQRHPEEPIEQRAGRAGLERIAHLAEDLALARHHRVEAGRDAEQVECRRLVGEPVENGGRASLSGTRELQEAALRTVIQIEVGGGCEIQLCSVAGGEHDRLTSVGERPRKATGAVEIDGDALAELDRGAVVRDAYERELHAAKWVRGSTTATRPKPTT